MRANSTVVPNPNPSGKKPSGFFGNLYDSITKAFK